MWRLTMSIALASSMWYMWKDCTLIYFLGLVCCAFLTSGGHKTLRKIYRTLPRDLRFSLIYGNLLFTVKKAQRRNLSLLELFNKNVKKHPGKTLFLYEDSSWTFKEVDEYSNRVGNCMLWRGLQKGDCVAMFMENCPEYVGIWLGLAKVGLIPAMVNYNLREQPLVHSVSAVNSKAVIYSCQLSSAISDIGDHLGDIQLFYLGTEDCKERLPGSCDLFYELSKVSPQPSAFPHKANFTDNLFYMYTSGTTGLPKAVIIKHSRYILGSAGIFHSVGLKTSDVMYCPLPMYHSGTSVLGIGQGLIFGLTLVLRRKFSVSAFWADCIHYHCTAAQYIGEICRYLLSAPAKLTDNQHSLRLMFGNGLRSQIWQEFQDRFAVGKIVEFYSSTEGNTNIANFEGKVGAVGFMSILFPAVNPCHLIKVSGSTGVPIRDSNGLCIQCKPGEPGEFVGMIVKGHPVKDFHGYTDKKATNAKVVCDVKKKGDNAFKSGDLMMMDEDGYLYFKDRTGDTFRWKGENVSTSEVESVLGTIIGLKDAVVYGVKIPGTEGRAGMAAILDPDNSIDLDKLAKGLIKCLPSYARPFFIRIAKTLDVTGTFKLKRVDLQEQGFDPTSVDDPLYFLDSTLGSYVPFSDELHSKIQNGQVKF